METPNMGLPRMLNETAVAKALSVSVSALRRWRREGRGPVFTHLEKCVRYDVREIDRFLAEHSSVKETQSLRNEAATAVSCDKQAGTEVRK